MLKKALVFAFIVAVGISPFLPKVFADNGEWHSSVADKAWEYDTHSVQRLALGEGVEGPYNFADTVFFTKKANNCSSNLDCDQVDLSIVKHGDMMNISDVNESVESRKWHLSHNDDFVFYINSNGTYNWFTAYKYESETKSVDKLMALTRKSNELSFESFATEGSRLYGSVMETDLSSGDVESSLLVSSFTGDYERRDFSNRLSAPWQEIVDVYGDLVLVKFQFSGGMKQLWLINERTQTMSAIYDTWTESPGDIVSAHFKSDGTVEYFKNFRLFTFDPKTQTKPTEQGGAFLNWFLDSNESVQVVGDRTAWLDPENVLYVNSLNGITKFSEVTDSQFTLLEDSVFYVSGGEYKEYDFETKKWTLRSYHVTDGYQDILVGIDGDNNVWYENTSTNKLVNIGYGTDPVLSDRAHAYFKGVDGHVYQASFSTLLDVPSFETPQAYKSYDSSTVYLLKDNSFWKVQDESVYFSWFDSWNSVAEVTDSVMKLYIEKYGMGGDATFSPGTRVMAAGNPRVYVMGSGGKLHWLVSETVANSIFGSRWNEDIVEVSAGYLWKYGSGKNVNSGADLKSI